MLNKSILLSRLISVILLLLIACESPEKTVEDKAADIHDQVLTIDTHADTPLIMGSEDFDIGQYNDPHEGGGKVDFPRMKEGGMDASFFAVYLPQGELTEQGYENARENALNIFDLIHDALDDYSEMTELALTTDDAYRLNEEGKLAIYIGVENGYPIGTDLSWVEKFYDLGARYITLAHNGNNDICDSATDSEPKHGGLSDFGVEVVEKMNELGMIVDVSHISDDAFYDVVEVSEAPVAATHSNARALRDVSRNMDDDMLLALKDNGGVIQVTFVSSFVKETEPNPERQAALDSLREQYGDFGDLGEEEMKVVREEWRKINQKYPRNLATVSDLVDHIDYIVDLIGVEHVGIGTDFDGGGALEDCFDVTEIDNITLELVERGYSKEEIEKIWSGNFMRVFREVEEIAAQ